ncbi:MAG: YHS domain-containing protein [Chloroflexota bacterium]|nr:YHS domain-containing protein [Candidatus Sulfotelmatobacter sp.]
MAKDPVCGMIVDEKDASLKSDYMGKTYYFCAPSCKETFDEDPTKYISGSVEHTGHGCCCCGGC